MYAFAVITGAGFTAIEQRTEFEFLVFEFDGIKIDPPAYIWICSHS